MNPKQLNALLTKPKALGLFKTQAANVVWVGGLIGKFAVHAALGKLLIQDRASRTQFFTDNASEYAKRAMKALGVEIDVIGLDKAVMHKKNFLLVSNHMSYVDVMVMASLVPTVFVTSVDMGETKFLGTIAELGGAIFVERRNRLKVERDIAQMTNSLKQGFNVVIYPEGTSSNGDQVLPFKKSLLMAAVEAERDILPVAIKYLTVDGEPVEQSNRDKICWYGDMEFMPHFLELLKVKSLRVQVEFLEPIKVTKESTRHDLADRAYESISKAYSAKVTPKKLHVV
jgi:1-acyl-sn-glycerol-3-phosphate acyltransferase